MHLQKNGWIFGSETGGDLFSFLFSLEITLAYGFQKKGHHLFGCRKSDYFAAGHQFYLKKGLNLNLSAPFFINCYSLLLLLLILKLEVRL